MNRLILILAAIVAFSATLFGQAIGDGSPYAEGKRLGNYESIMNAFIAVIAKDHPELKKDIKRLKQGQEVPAGTQVGRSTNLGDYCFTPKSWKDLSLAEQSALKKHPKLKSFLVSLRNASNYPAISSVTSDATPPKAIPVEGARPTGQTQVRYEATIPADEMLRNRPITIRASAIQGK